MTASPTACRARSTARRLLTTSALLLSGVLGFPPAHAANPQPYTIDWMSSGVDAVDDLLPATSQLATLRKSAPVDPFGLIARARGDVSRLRTVLDSFGYYEGSITITINGLGLDSANLVDTLTALPKGTGARVKISPGLGPLFHVGRIDIEGKLPSGMAQKVGLPSSLLGLASGAPAVASDVLTAGTALQTALEDAGYAFAKVDKPVAYEKPEQRVLDLVYRVTAGPRVRIGAIRIEGLEHVHESLVRRRLLLHTGAPYDAAAVEKARQDLLALGVFASVTVRLGNAPDHEGRVPITFLVREGKRFTFGVSAAYSSDLGGSGGVSWSNGDVFGNGEQFSIAASAINLGGTASTGLGYDLTIGYTLPEFHRRDQALHFGVTAIRQALLAYTQTSETAGVSLSRKLSMVWTATAGVSYAHEIIGQQCPYPSDGATLPSTGQPPSCSYDYNLLLVPLTAAYDSTNLASPLLDPTGGMRVSINVTPTFSYGSTGALHGGGTATYLISQASLTTYLDMHKLFPRDPAGRTVLAARAMVGQAQGALWYNLPPDQRFYAGGSGTVRGYRYQSVGPQFETNGVPNGIPTGGTTLQVVNLELRQRVGTNFGFAIFADGGGVSRSTDPLSGTFRVGAGAGMRYYTAIGPIRFDIAVPTNRRQNDDRFELYIGIGQAF